MVNGRIMTIEDDNGNDTTIDARDTYTYDASGNNIRIDHDTNADGAPNSIDHFEYDVMGNNTFFRRDTNADGAIDRVTEKMFNAANQLVPPSPTTRAATWCWPSSTTWAPIPWGTSTSPSRRSTTRSTTWSAGRRTPTPTAW
jgi:hypothetical protein